MYTVGAFEAKTHLSKLLDRVAKGERITIEKHGVPVAILQPVDAAKQRPPGKSSPNSRSSGPDNGWTAFRCET